jgi:hypothetical protein
VSRDQKDYIKQNGERTIKWDAHAKEGMDGFDFRPSPSTQALKFELYIDGKAAPVDEVKLGRNKTRATSVPVVINLGADELKGHTTQNMEKIEPKKSEPRPRRASPQGNPDAAEDGAARR